MRVEDEIRTKLEAAFSPSALSVQDESEQHRGHAGYQEGGESHFNVMMRAEELGAMNRVARHRAVHKALGPELVARIHALALDIDG